MKTSVLEIDRGVVKYANTVMSVRNISEVTTFVPEVPFPGASAALLAIGLLLCLLSTVFDATAMLLGLVLLCAGGVWAAMWYFMQASVPKGVTIKMNSGACTTLSFADNDLANQVASALERAIQTENVSQVFNLPNATVVNSAIGNVGSFFKNVSK